jgi:hypothetical protein
VSIFSLQIFKYGRKPAWEEGNAAAGGSGKAAAASCPAPLVPEPAAARFRGLAERLKQKNVSENCLKHKIKVSGRIIIFNRYFRQMVLESHILFLKIIITATFIKPGPETVFRLFEKPASSAGNRLSQTGCLETLRPQTGPSF